ncbi:MAG: (2Fe-2S)-binding protein [Solirubrobacteraceae bacterium]
MYLDGQPIDAHPGESVAAAMLAAGRAAFRVTPSGAPRGPFCNMGACFDCVVQIDGQPDVRACITPVRAGMAITTELPTESETELTIEQGLGTG